MEQVRFPDFDSNQWVLWDRETEYVLGYFEYIVEAANWAQNNVEEEFIPDLILVKEGAEKVYCGWEIINA